MATGLQLGAEGSESLEEAAEFLQLENDFLTSLLQRLAPGLLDSGAATAAADADRPGWEPLLMAEKHELLVAEAAATRREIERVQAEGELELTCAQAGVADAAGQQAAETARDVAALLSLLGLPPPPAAEAAQALGSALGRAELHGGQLAQFLEDVLARHDGNAERYQMRNDMLQNSLARAEAALGSRADLGSTLTKVDFEAQRIEHSQAEAALAAASADAVALKAQVVAAAERLAEQRSALAAVSGATGALARQAGTREQQVALLAGEVAKAQRECAVLERECARLREQRQQQGGPGTVGSPAAAAACAKASGACSAAMGSSSSGSSPTILEYMTIKNACAGASKRIADWQRKLEVQAGRRGAAAARSV
ncbi:hypothetical protein ABPG75_005406 [Micractinium tetrahymenae]